MASKKRKCPECEEGAPAWLATYGDMVTLLLTFFVMLFTVATIDGREFRLILSAFQGSMGMFEGGQTLSKGKLEQMGMTLESLPATEKGTSMAKAVKIATEIFKPEIKMKRVRIHQVERGLVISLIGEDYFAPGSAKLTKATKSTLTKLAKLLRQVESFIRIEGHADETPVATGPASNRYETNWELASQRSINVLRYLHEYEDVEPAKMSATTYGKYRPMVSSNTIEGKAINRRVDILILAGKLSKRQYKDLNLPKSKVPGIEWDIK